MTDNESDSRAADLTGAVGAATDVAPLGRDLKPAHELTAIEDAARWAAPIDLAKFE